MSFIFLSDIPGERLELSRACAHWILSPTRLPVPPSRHDTNTFVRWASYTCFPSFLIRRTLSTPHVVTQSKQAYLIPSD